MAIITNTSDWHTEQVYVFRRIDFLVNDMQCTSENLQPLGIIFLLHYSRSSTSSLSTVVAILFLFFFLVAYSSCKRKRVTLFLEKKLDIWKEFTKALLLSVTAVEFGPLLHTYSIKRGRDKIVEFASECCDSSSLKADDGSFDRAMHLWFLQVRHNSTSVSGSIVTEKARLLYEQLYMYTQKWWKMASKLGLDGCIGSNSDMEYGS